MSNADNGQLGGGGKVCHHLCYLRVDRPEMRAFGGVNLQNQLNLKGIFQPTQLSARQDEKHNAAKNKFLSPPKRKRVEQTYIHQGRTHSSTESGMPLPDSVRSLYTLTRL